jgi:hypothetical protein
MKRYHQEMQEALDRITAYAEEAVRAQREGGHR